MDDLLVEQLIIPLAPSGAETIWTYSRPVDQQYRHAVLTASSASFFADITLRIEPADHVDTVFFCTAVRDDPSFFTALPEWVAGVRDGVIAFLTERAQQRQPISGITITLVDLVEHPVDSKRRAYHRAAVLAMQEACAQPGALRAVSSPSRSV